MKRFFAALSALICLFACSCSYTSVEFGYFEGEFSPFFARTYQDLSVVDMTQETLLVTSGDEQAKPVYDAYTQGLGIADIDVEYGENRTVCTVKLGHDIEFSDGTPLTSKDAAFSIYVYAQADYDGWSTLGKSALDGLCAYRYGTTAAENIVIDDNQLASELASPSPRTAELIRSRIILPVLTEEYKWVTHLYGDDSYVGTEVEKDVQKYPDPRDLFAYYYATDLDYKASAAGDDRQVISDIADMYGSDYKTLGDVYGADLGDMANDCARQALTERALESVGDKDAVTSIRGVEIVDDYTLKITINSTSEKQLEDVLGIYVAPFHYYGEGCEFDGGGFKIDLQSVEEKSGDPLGAGRYVFKGYTAGKGARFVKNKGYFRDVVPESSVRFTESGNTSGDYAASDWYITPDNRMYVER